MSRHDATLPPGYFDAIYAADPDPWRFAASEYERLKYAATLTALPRSRYRHALEIGCSIGVFTRALAQRCDAVTALDVARAALDQAQARCRDVPGVAFALMQVPAAWPAGRFDLLVLSEVVYYLDRADVARLARRAAGCLEPGADIVLVHWLGDTHYPLTGDEAADLFMDAVSDFATPTLAERSEHYRLDRLRVGARPTPATGA